MFAISCAHCILHPLSYRSVLKLETIKAGRDFLSQEVLVMREDVEIRARIIVQLAKRGKKRIFVLRG